jgi:hypothetical protein
MGPNAFSLSDYLSIIRLSAGSLHHDTIVFNLIPGFAKIAPWCLASRDKLLAKVLGTLRSAQGWPAGLRHQRFLLIPATVIAHFRCEKLMPIMKLI